jgi:hypothetical protein
MGCVLNQLKQHAFAGGDERPSLPHPLQPGGDGACVGAQPKGSDGRVQTATE